MDAWIQFEKAFNERVASFYLSGSIPVPTAQLIKRHTEFSPALRAELTGIQRLRNDLVHGRRPLTIKDLASAADRLR